MLFVGLAIVTADLGLKRALRQRLACAPLSLGPLGSLRTVTGRLWLLRSERPIPALAAGALWGALAVPLLAVAVWVPPCRVPVCLLLAGSGSNLLEHAARGSITDYVCLRRWPAFNLADVALTVGALSLLATGLGTVAAVIA
ncbi:MAG TPA: signal peptidase II [Planctomycetota bacterium]|nr:signal peptidase II [Planctomycetota bacterium]